MSVNRNIINSIKYIFTLIPDRYYFMSAYAVVEMKVFFCIYDN